jgi:dienelactone hydrolase
VASTHAWILTSIFLLRVLPVFPSGPVDRLTRRPIVETVSFPAPQGASSGDLYRPPTPGPHPAVLVCLGVVPFAVDHPQVERLGQALARSGLAALLYWSPSMRDLRLEADDAGAIALAYDWLIAQPHVDPARSGLLGTCVGGAFALLAAARDEIRERVAFVLAFAPYSSMWTLAADIASQSHDAGTGRRAWPVDQRTQAVFLRTLTAALPADEAALLREAHALERPEPPRALSPEGGAVHRLLTAGSYEDATAALARLPQPMRAQLDALSPLHVLPALEAPLVVFGHDRDDLVIPVGESRRLSAALRGRAGVEYTEFTFFQHLEPRRLPLARLARELFRFTRYVYPLFGATSPPAARSRASSRVR